MIQADDTGAQVQTTIVNAPSAPTLAGVVVNVRVSARGAPDTVTIAGDAELNATARSMIRSLSSAQQTFGAVLPVEPVGIGASWRVAGTTEISGIQMATVTTYHLDGIAGDKLTYHADTKITAADQDVALSGSSGATAHLDQATITGTEHATMDLRHPGGASTSTVSGTEDLTMQGPDGKVAAHERITLETTVAPLSP
ncbi:MAG: DUF6263 family protein [Acidimicrobiales bacterium]